MIALSSIRDRFSHLSVLIVDDDEMSISMQARLYSRIFDNLFIATNGLEGVEIFKNNKIDIVISDITMPICSGLEMGAKLREITNDLKIIFVSAQTDKIYIDEILQLGGYFLNKPVLLDSLVEILDKIQVDKYPNSPLNQN